MGESNIHLIVANLRALEQVAAAIKYTLYAETIPGDVENFLISVEVEACNMAKLYAELIE